MQYFYYLGNIKQSIFKILILITLTLLTPLAQADSKLINTIGQTSPINDVFSISTDNLGNSYIFELISPKNYLNPKFILMKKINAQGLLESQFKINDINLRSPVINKKMNFIQ